MSKEEYGIFGCYWDWDLFLKLYLGSLGTLVFMFWDNSPSETFHEAWEWLRDLTRECPHLGVSNQKLTVIFYEGLGPQDRYLLDAASGSTLLSKDEDDVMELIDTMMKNSHHNATKLFQWGDTLRGQMIFTNLVETSMLLDRIEKTA